MTAEQVIPVRARAGDYDIRVGPGLLSRLGAQLRDVGLEGRLALIADARVFSLWGAQALDALEREGFRVDVLEIPPGEGSKSLAGADRLWGELISRGLSRADTMVALGGGVAGDLAGFVAATFHRGMAFVQVPTSLLAQVDAAIGGKVAIDHRLGKNLVGAFHSPKRVIADTETLSTLPSRERWSGLAEVAKSALIADVGLLELLERDLEALGNGEARPATLAEVVARTVKVKAEIVSADERESGQRMWLNFGHTVGHALEASCGYGPLTHGEAVVLGMRAALWVSERLGKLAASDANRASALLGRFPPPPPCTPPSSARVKEVLGRDKKAKSGTVRFVVLEALGAAGIEPGLPEPLLDEAIERAIADLSGGGRS